MYTMGVPGAHRGQKKELGVQKLKLWADVSHLMWTLDLNPRCKDQQRGENLELLRDYVHGHDQTMCRATDSGGLLMKTSLEGSEEQGF